MQCDWLRELVQQNHVIPRYVGRDLGGTVTSELSIS